MLVNQHEIIMDQVRHEERPPRLINTKRNKETNQSKPRGSFMKYDYVLPDDYRGALWDIESTLPEYV